MKKAKTIQYILDTSIEDMILKVKNDKMVIGNVISACMESRKEFGLKVQDLIKRLSEMSDE